MFKNRLFHGLIAIALMVTIALTVREAYATASLVAKTDLTTSQCASLPSRSSIHSGYRKDTGMRLTYTEDGPTGLDGGLMYLMSAYRTCSR